jgi:hypothetical protein
LGHERDSPEVNVWWGLSHEVVIEPVFYEDRTTNSLFLYILENNVLPQLNNNNLILRLDKVAVHCAHIVLQNVNVNLTRSRHKKRRNRCVASSFSSYFLGVFSLGPCERPGVQPKSEYGG